MDGDGSTMVLGIDPSLTSTGLVRIKLCAGGRFEASTATVITKPTGGSFAARSARIAYICGQIKRRLDGIDVVVLEGPAYAAQGQAHTAGWLWGRIFDLCSVELAIHTIVAYPQARMKYATGKGNAAKDAVLAAAIKRFPMINITGNDIADATILAAIGCRQIGYPIDNVPQSHWQPAMAKLAA